MRRGEGNGVGLLLLMGGALLALSSSSRARSPSVTSLALPGPPDPGGGAPRKGALQMPDTLISGPIVEAARSSEGGTWGSWQLLPQHVYMGRVELETRIHPPDPISRAAVDRRQLLEDLVQGFGRLLKLEPRWTIDPAQLKKMHDLGVAQSQAVVLVGGYVPEVVFGPKALAAGANALTRAEYHDATAFVAFLTDRSAGTQTVKGQVFSQLLQAAWSGA